MKGMFLRAVIIAVVLVAAPAVASAASWWNQDWQYRKEVGFDLTPQGADIAGSPADVPVLVRLSLANFNYFNDAKPDGSDFRVISGDDKTPLKFHFERYDAQNQMAFLWVRVPRLTGGAKSDRVYVYYGNPKAPTAEEAGPTYDADATLVLHFSESGGLPVDSTAYQNKPTVSTAERAPASLIAGGAKFAGGQSITVPASASLRLIPASGFTAAAWVKIDGAAASSDVIALEDGGKSLVLGIDGTKAFARLAGAGAPITVTQGTGELATGQWHHLALRVGSGQLALYVDGAEAGTAPVTAVEIGGVLTIGASARGSNFLAGEVDEVQVSKVARAPEWIKAAARGQAADGPLVLFGADGQREGGQTSYFGTIAKNLTADGWVVIGICFAMLILAILVMIAKAFFLSRVERANRHFLAEYQKLSGDARALDKPSSEDEQELEDSSPLMAALTEGKDSMSISTLFQLYHRGVAEINKRVSPPGAAGQRTTVLSPQSIQAIRAAMDATSVRQQQRLSAQMVLLTIAISGGPFLGLLGTVIGVMITFAAIALSGDVNVNAIAPGTAAALAATVAGLSVAIPSLFGYNWLNTRIKSINADNRVFLDEFVTRVAEQYS
jgi:biopolymer transport protein ExbB